MARRRRPAARGPGRLPAPGRAPARQPGGRCGTLVCHWHGLALDGGPFAGWEPVPRPRRRGAGLGAAGRGRRRGARWTARCVPARPGGRAAAVDAVYTVRRAVRTGGRGRQPPRPVARRVVPPVLLRRPDAWPRTPGGGEDDDAFAVDVSFRVAGRLVVPVRAVFTAPGPRTVVMRITDGEGPAPWWRPMPRR